MKRALVITCLTLSLAACGKSPEELHAEWMQFCTTNEFSAKQCEVLYALKSSSDDARRSADNANAAANVAIGFGGAAMGSRR